MNTITKVALLSTIVPLQAFAVERPDDSSAHVILSSIEVVQERNKDYIASIIFHNEGTPFGGETIHKFTIPEGDIVIKELITPNGQYGCCDDQYEVLSVPDGYIADETTFNLKEGDHTVVFIRKWEGM